MTIGRCAFRSIKFGFEYHVGWWFKNHLFTPFAIAGFLTALSTTEDQLIASIPFDKDSRNGFVMGEKGWACWFLKA